MNKYKEILFNNLNNQICPECGNNNISIDNWGIFEGKEDWFYYCKECDFTFEDKED